MVYELVRLTVDSERTEEYESTLDHAKSLIASIPGFISLELCRSIENRETGYILLIVWETIEAHLEGFLKSSVVDEWRQLVVPFYTEKPSAEHFEVVVKT